MNGPDPPPDLGTERTVDRERRRLIVWLWRLPVLTALGGGGYGLYRAYRLHFGKRAPSSNPRFAPRPEVRVAGVAEFTEVWAERNFTIGGTPSVALRVPRPVPGGLSPGEDLHLVAFSRICTHQGCLVTLNRNLEAVAVAFNHRTEVPALTCACHLTVFAPDRAGRAVSGPAVLPLPRVRLETRSGELWATGVES